MMSIFLLKNTPAEIGRMLAEEQQQREIAHQQAQQRNQENTGMQEYFARLREQIEQKKRETAEAEKQLQEMLERMGVR